MTTPTPDNEIDEIVAQYYHRWVKYGYYGTGDTLNDDTEFQQATAALTRNRDIYALEKQIAELERACSHNNSEYTSDYLEDRIIELRQTLAKLEGKTE